MDAREDLPKVSIETEQNWKRIQRNSSNAFLERLDKELETRGRTGDKDELLPQPNINQLVPSTYSESSG